MYVEIETKHRVTFRQCMSISRNPKFHHKVLFCVSYVNFSTAALHRKASLHLLGITSLLLPYIEVYIANHLQILQQGTLIRDIEYVCVACIQPDPWTLSRATRVESSILLRASTASAICGRDGWLGSGAMHTEHRWEFSRNILRQPEQNKWWHLSLFKESAKLTSIHS